MVEAINDPHHTPSLESPGGTIEAGNQDGVIDPAEVERTSPRNRKFLELASHAYEGSKNWFDTSQRVVFEKALSNFRSVHPPGSKYHTTDYQKRSRIFRPKTRAAIRRGEAGHAVAFFSTQDVVHCSPVNSSDDNHTLVAEIHGQLLNMRLNKPEMKWFQTVIGAAQDAMTVGVVISKQYWNYRSITQDYQYEYEEEFLDERGMPQSRTVYDMGQEEKILADHPVVDLLPVENFRFDPACDWRDPVNTSPYLIELQPTYVKDIKERVGQGRYWDLRTDMLSAATQQDWDSVRKMREGQRIDKYTNDQFINDYRIVWVHHNTIRVGGQDYVYDTLGHQILLEEPRPIEEVYAHASTGDRPYALGCSIIEAHKPYPSGVPQMIEDLQEEVNDIANLRLDNVKHAINKRWFIRRGRGVDIRALIRNVPGSGVLMSDPSTDVKEIQTRDVTSSSYQEQTRIDLDIDDIVGNFSQASVQNNRQLNETVGGMNMLQGDANLMQEYMIRTVSETWMEPVLRQLVRMEAVYESDDEILRVVSGSMKREMEEVLQAITTPVNVNVNVGFNATNPTKRIEKLALGLSTVANFAPHLLQDMDASEAVKEVFGALGYQDGARFFPNLMDPEQDPRIAQLEQQIAELMQIVESNQMEIEGKKEVAHITGQYGLAKEKIKADVAVMKEETSGDREQLMAMMKNRLDEIDKMLDAEKTAIDRQELWLQREALSHQIQKENRQMQMDEEDRAAARVEGDGMMDLKGNDKGGVMKRDQYDLIPQNSM